jgi:hypothetical protein
LIFSLIDYFHFSTLPLIFRHYYFCHLLPLRHYAIALIIDIAYAIDDAMLTLLLMPLMPCHYAIA